MQQKQNSPKGLVFLITAAVVWGFAFVAQNVGGDKVPPFYFNGIRFVLGAVALIPVIALFEKGAVDKKRLKTTVIAGICAGGCLWLASYLQQIGIVMTDSSGKAGFITGLYMILVPIIRLLFGQKTGVQTWIGALCGVGGLFLICMNGGALTFTRGDLFLIGCAIVFACHILVIDRFGDAIYSIRFSAIQFAAAAFLNLIFGLLFEEITLSGVREAAIPLLYCGIFSSGVAYTCQVLGQKYSEPTSASIILSTESVFSAIGGALLLHERMTGAAYVGCALIFAGILLSQVKVRFPLGRGARGNG